MKFIRGALTLILSLWILANPYSLNSYAETCPNYDLSKIFNQEFYPNLKWDTSKGSKVIKWTTNVTSVNNAPVSKSFNSDEDKWLQDSFNAWDMALDTISFQRITDSSQADLIVGFTVLQNNGFWTVQKDEVNPNIRVKATIQISSTTPVILTKNGFITVALSEIGNMLGLGDILQGSPEHSVMMDPDQPPFGVLPLEDFDISMIRQFYGESTCPSSWGAELKKAKADYLAAVEQAKKDADAAATAKAQAELQAAADKAAADKKAQEDAIRAALNKGKTTGKKVTITCVKGKLTKKVTAVNPKCPSGYKKK